MQRVSGHNILCITKYRIFWRQVIGDHRQISWDQSTPFTIHVGKENASQTLPTIYEYVQYFFLNFPNPSDKTLERKLTILPDILAMLRSAVENFLPASIYGRWV